jgi:hypothetical protein
MTTKLSRAFVIASIGILAASAVSALYHHFTFIEQMLRALL